MTSAKRLNLGSGMQRQIVDAVNLDIVPNSRADVIHDLNEYPWPFEDNRFEEVYCFDILEHLNDIVLSMQEIHRISSHGGKIVLTTPHFSSRNAYTDPTHKHFFGIHSFDYFLDNGHSEYSKMNFYSSARFQKTRLQIYFEHSLFNSLIERVVKIYPDFWEKRYCWIFPAWYMELELQTVKSIDPS